MEEAIRILRLGLLLVMLGLCASWGWGQPINPRTLREDIGIEQKLGAFVQADAVFKDEDGKTVKIANYLNQGKPVILVPMFYRCGGTCIQISEGSIKCFRAMRLKDIGRDYLVLNIGIHPKETPDLAKVKKIESISSYDPNNKRPTAASGWHFLTGDLPNIKKLLDSVGYTFEYDAVNDRLAHPAGMILLTPDGQISKYFYGFQYSQRFLIISLNDAQSMRVGSKEEPRFFGCLSVDPATGQVTLNVMRSLQVAGVLTVVLLFGGILFMTFKYRRSKLDPISERKFSL